MTQKGFSSALIVFGVLILLVTLFTAYNVGKKARDPQPNPSPSANSINQKHACLSDKGCWFDAEEGKMGYGNLKGYYMSIKENNSTCDVFVPASNDPVFYNLSGRTYAPDSTPVLSINLENISTELKQKIKASSKNQQITLSLVQIPSWGKEFIACLPPSVSILGIAN